ncbi:MAG: pimeloyl-ACP methyl ester carboxylesterase [Chitinophagales bacterium]|jgi:pimeloyl-ACP methyl ester carboxylesterase
MAHGLHSESSQYGRAESGVSFRIGDYYRVWANAHAKAGLKLRPLITGASDSEGLNNMLQAEKVEFTERFYTSDLIAAIDVLENSVLVGHSMGGPISFYAANQIRAISQIKNKVKLVSLCSTAKYQLSKINVSANYVIHHAKYDVINSVSNIEFCLQDHKKQLLKKFLYESKQHLLSADDFDHAVSTDIQLIREIENGNH